MEVWKDIDGYIGKYQVSSKGRVKSLERLDSIGRKLPERILKQGVGVRNTRLVALCSESNMRTFLVHILVAKAFLGKSSKPQVNHIDEDPANNNLTNLEWCTAKENSNYGTRNKRISRSSKNGKRSKKVVQYSLDGKTIKVWVSFNELKRNGFNFPNIWKCCNGLRNKANGFKWGYYD